MKLDKGSVFSAWLLSAMAAAVLGCGPSAGQGSQDLGVGGNGGDDLAVGGNGDLATDNDHDLAGVTGGPDMTPPGPPLTDLTGFVNPFIGTAKAPNVTNPVGGGSGGSDFPGASVPWGSIAFSPDTPNGEPSGYAYEDTSITGFSLTHFSGAGCPNGGDLPILALVDPAATSFPFQHAHEHAAPGYYDVTSDANVRVELTATLRTGMARFTFPAGSNATVVFDASRSQTASKITSFQVTPAATNDGLTGYSQGGRFCGGGTFPVYFSVKFDRAWTKSTIQNGKAVLSFDAGSNQTVKMKIGISYFSQPNAQLNLDGENSGFDFDAVRAAAKQAWNQRLNAIEVGGGSDDDKTKFYTALYHALLHPNVYSDVTGDYMGFDSVTHKTDAGRVQYANFSGWDIYRSQVQLAALLFPDVWSDVLQSLVNDAQQCGAFPKWSQNNVEDNVMAGDPGSLIVANAYAFGAKNFDTAGALAVMRQMSLVPGTACNGAVELPALDSYIGLGYTPLNWSASDALEYGARDAAVAQFATALGSSDLARIVTARSGYWRNQLNTSATPNPSIEPRNGNGTWPTPLAPADGFNNGFTEASAEQYTWYVPQDLRSLFDAFGGNSAVVKRLDAFFTNINAGGTSAYCYIGNEPDFSTPFLYDWAGAPWRTQDVVRRALTEAFTTAPGGMAGNDDLGAMSSLIAWFMMGMYPELPGVGGVALASPSFAAITLHLPAGKTFKITTSGLPGRYVQSAKLNGTATTRLWLPAATMLAGGTLDFTLGDSPSTWGSAAGDAPPSFGPGTFTQLGAAFNSRCITTDAAPNAGNCDGFSWSYSAEALAAAGVTGTTFTFNNVAFPWPAASSTLDNFIPSGQTISVSTTQSGGKLAVLGSASAGPSTGTGTLTYSDGTTKPFTLGFSDWTLGGGGATPMAGNQIALTTTYRHNTGGGKDTVKTYIFYTEVPLDAGKTLASVTLPPTVSAGRMHVFSFAVAP
jgi:predicted alpha-1,2-mannosidase